jgi:hypothetical protein
MRGSMLSVAAVLVMLLIGCSSPPPAKPKTSSSAPTSAPPPSPEISVPKPAPPSAQPAPDSPLGDRVLEENAGFSYCPPTGWGFQENKKLAARTAQGPAVEGFASSLYFAWEKSTGNFAEDSKALVAWMVDALKNAKLIGQGEFTTADKVTCVRVVLECDQKERRLRQVHYLIPGGPGGKILRAAGSCPVQDGEKMASLFDTTLATFKWENK